MEGGQSGTYLKLARASSSPWVSVTKTYRDETKMNILARSQLPSSAEEGLSDAHPWARRRSCQS